MIKFKMFLVKVTVVLTRGLKKNLKPYNIKSLRTDSGIIRVVRYPAGNRKKDECSVMPLAMGGLF